jgi:hypothetical protein
VLDPLPGGAEHAYTRRMLAGLWGKRAIAALSLVVMVVACSTTYGDEDPDSGASPAQGNDAGSDGPNLSGDIDGGGDTGSLADAASDVTTSLPPCPSCPGSQSCIGAGCSSVDAPTSSCTEPKDINAPQSVFAFVCPDAPTFDFSQQCVPGGGLKAHHAAVFRMIAPHGWHVTVDDVAGSNVFIAEGNCMAFQRCSGGTNGPSSGLDVGATGTVIVGTTNQLATCQAIGITFAKN